VIRRVTRPVDGDPPPHPDGGTGGLRPAAKWTDELTDEMDIALLRGSCFDTARRIDGVET
jgi:hypothetical protein